MINNDSLLYKVGDTVYIPRLNYLGEIIRVDGNSSILPYRLRSLNNSVIYYKWIGQSELILVGNVFKELFND